MNPDAKVVVTDESRPVRSRRLIVFVAAAIVLGLVTILWFWLSRGKELATLRGHRGVVRSVAFAADGRTLASAGDDGEIRIWDADSHDLRRILTGHAGAVNSLAFAPNGSTLASTGADGTVRLWDHDSGKELAVLPASNKPVDCVAFTPDGAVLAAAGVDGLVHVWQVNDGRPLRTLPVHRKRVRAVAFSSDRHTLATGCDDGVVRLWDWTSGKSLRRLRGGGRVFDLAYTSDNRILAAAATGGFQSWDVGLYAERERLPEGSGSLRCLAFSSDGSEVATGHEDGAVKLWKVADGRLVTSFKGHSGPVMAIACAPDGTIIASAGSDGTVKLWQRD